MNQIAFTVDRKQAYSIDLSTNFVRRKKIDAVASELQESSWLVCDGLVDLQVNGYEGIDVSNPDLNIDGVMMLCEKLAAVGVTHFLPTLTTNSLECLGESLENLSQLYRECELFNQMMLGIHLEGPFISSIDGPRGAHPREFCRPPDYQEFCRLQDKAGGKIVVVTMSPEFDNANEFIAKASKSVIVSIGHTAATPEQIRMAVDHGASMSTHLGNGMHRELVRHPNYLWEQLADDRLVAGIIGDGVHLDSSTMKAMFRAKGVDRIFLVSDSTVLSGMSPGLYRNSVLGDVEVTGDSRLVIAGQRMLNAGAYRPLKDAVPFFGSNQIATLDEVMRMMCFNPRKFLADKIKKIGGLESWNENFVLFRVNSHLELEIGLTIVGGKIVYQSNDYAEEIVLLGD